MNTYVKLITVIFSLVLPCISFPAEAMTKSLLNLTPKKEHFALRNTTSRCLYIPFSAAQIENSADDGMSVEITSIIMKELGVPSILVTEVNDVVFYNGGEHSSIVCLYYFKI